MSHLSLSQDCDSLKCWKENDKLTWTDFKGSMPEGDTSLNLNANTVYRLQSFARETNGSLSYDIKLTFLRYRSWTTDTSANLLRHEQLHFDIGELYARKLRKAIQWILKTNPNATEEDFKTIIHKIYRENTATQTRYDEETLHGIISEAQAEWEETVVLELKQLVGYASKNEDCQW